MIDTDRYEGHTPAPWKWITDDKDTYLSCFDNDIKVDEDLIADAPLLLAEVKRLRKEINQLPIDLHESLDMILEAHYPEVRESVMAMFGDAWGNNLTGYEE